MLFVADRNRRRVHCEVRDFGAAARLDVDAVRRTMLVELLSGLVIIRITAAIEVSAPATSGVGG